MITTKTLSLLQAYRKDLNSYDEILNPAGKIKPHWAKLFTSIEKLGLEELKNRNQEIIDKLRENGVTYNVYGSPDGLNRPWQLDPIPFIIEQKEWNEISEGLKQRAVLLDLMLKDIYGPRTLIKDGILPAELIFGNTGFSRPCDDIKIPGEHRLFTFAADIARGPDGRMWLLDNRTQAPSGSGYTLENRSVISKLLPELSEGMFVHKLSPYFTNFQESVAGLSNRSKDNLNTVYLTPGPNNETFFEHAYLAFYLGYTLVQGDDLIVRDGFVWMKSIEGLQKVDIIIRRLDDEWCDPLELREDSRLGVPGLLQAIRLGNVAVINPPGSSVLENNALLAFMQNASRHLLGEDLRMPSIATWWCGQPKELQYVLENLDKLIIRKANRKQKFRSIHGMFLTEAERNELKKNILANPAEYVAQEEVSFSTIPSLVDDQIEPRYAAFRAFLFSSKENYYVMQGGLTRSSPEKDRFIISNQYGGISKDTWIVSDEPEDIRERINIPVNISALNLNSLPSRSAEKLYWAGRYSERALAVTTFINLTLNSLHSYRNVKNSSDLGEHIKVLLRSLTHLTLTYPGFIPDDNSDGENLFNNPYPEILELITDSSELGSIAANLQMFLDTARAVREKWNLKTWRVIDSIEEILQKIKTFENLNSNSIQKLMDKIQSRIFTFYGVISESMTRDNGYFLLETGKLIERSLNKINVMRSILGFRYEDEVEDELIEAVLLNNYSLVNYRSIYKSEFRIETMLDMLLLDSQLPYSLTYQLDALAKLLDNLPHSGQHERINQAQKAILEATAKIKLADIAQLRKYNQKTLYRKDLDKLLSEVSSLVASVSVSLTNMYFSHTVMQHSFWNFSEDNINEI
jgi:uncharacterized circularly permuted ATP-grasp superfamily protein/uncharacterized alpha-E superfamily protein